MHTGRPNGWSILQGNQTEGNINIIQNWAGFETSWDYCYVCFVLSFAIIPSHTAWPTSSILCTNNSCKTPNFKHTKHLGIGAEELPPVPDCVQITKLCYHVDVNRPQICTFNIAAEKILEDGLASFWLSVLEFKLSKLRNDIHIWWKYKYDGMIYLFAIYCQIICTCDYNNLTTTITTHLINNTKSMLYNYSNYK